MEAEHFICLAERLTGTPVKDVSSTDREILGSFLADDSRPIGHSQLNELLLLVNKDRTERAFFDYFFGGPCSVGTLQAGVLKFQKVAMLCFGNFIYAYRTLSRAASVPSLEAELDEWAYQPDELAARFAKRSPKLIDIELIPRQHTSLVGYISAGEVVAESERCAFLRYHLPALKELGKATWEAYQAAVLTGAGAAERPALQSLIANYRKHHGGATVQTFAEYLVDVTSVLDANSAQLNSVRTRATLNQGIYLT